MTIPSKVYDPILFDDGSVTCRIDKKEATIEILKLPLWLVELIREKERSSFREGKEKIKQDFKKLLDI